MKIKAARGDTSISTGMPQMPALQQLGERPGMDRSAGSSEGTSPAHILTGDSQPPELGGNTFLVFKPQTVALAMTNRQRGKACLGVRSWGDLSKPFVFLGLSLLIWKMGDLA